MCVAHVCVVQVMCIGQVTMCIEQVTLYVGHECVVQVHTNHVYVGQVTMCIGQVNLCVGQECVIQVMCVV